MRTNLGTRGGCERAAITVLCTTVIALVMAPGGALAQRGSTRRARFDQRGDITFAANSIMTCRAGTTSGGQTCEAARASATSDRIDNDYPMVPIDADSDATTFSSSSSDLVLPAGATVTWAGLYWQCITSGGGSTAAPNAARRNRVLFATPDAPYAEITASVLDDQGSIFQGFAEVTDRVRGPGDGTYWVGNVQCASGAANHYGGWSLVVVYQDSAQPLRNLVVYDAFRNYDTTSVDIAVSGFTTPPMGPVTSRVGVIFYDGDRRNGDTITLISGARTTQLGSAPGVGVVNPRTDIGNGTVTRGGANVTTRMPAFVNTLGFDADILDTVDALPNGATSATIRGQTSGEFILFGVITFATDIFAPDVRLSKSVTDVNGGQLMPGDVLEYTITASNSGMDPALEVVVSDAMPAGTTYVPGSLRIAGAARTDAAGDDTARFDAASRTALFHIGTGATATLGGRVDVGSTFTMTFRVTIDLGISGGTEIRNTATASYYGLTIGSGTVYAGTSDGDPVAPGEQPTGITLGAICNDRVITAPESCDDGGVVPGDGCSDRCRAEVRIVAPDGTTISDSTPSITGTADPGAVVTVRVDGVVVGMATADASGAWSVTVGSALLDGAHAIAADATDVLAHASSDAATFTLDSTTMVAITAPAAGSATRDTTPTISGTGEPGAMITVIVDMAVIGTVTVAADGTWTIDVPTALGEGPHAVDAMAVDAVGNMASASSTFRVDLSTSVAITAPDEGMPLMERMPTFSGTGEPGATVVITIDGAMAGSTTVAADGTWSFTPSTPIADGMRTVVATATDTAGNTATDTAVYTVDAGTYVAITSPAEGSATNDSTPTIRGTGEPGVMVSVTVDGASVGTTTVAADGTWSVEVTSALADGPHSVVATATEDGETATDDASFEVDTSTRVDFRQPGDQGPIGDSSPELSGTSEPGASVEITVDGAVIGTVIADAEGNWTLQLATPLADGEHSVSVRATDDAGNTATDTGSFEIDSEVPALELRSPADGSRTSDTTPTIVGDADPGAMVVVLVDGVMVGTVTADENGHWSLELTTALTAGAHEVLATTTNAAGNTAVDVHEFTVDAGAPSIAITEPADGSETADTTPTIRGTAEPGASVEVFVDGQLVGTATAAADGTWSVDTTTALSDGTHTVRAVATDADGNTATAGGSFVVDTATRVAITQPADGGTVGSARPTIRGTAEPGAVVSVTIDGAPIGMTTAGPDGSWSIATTSDLAAGMHTASATARDEVGNEASADSDFTYDPSMLDTDGDGIVDTDECPSMPCRDSDMDGDPDFDDPDDDGDGIPTSIECTTPAACVDTNMDGDVDYLDPDDDGDGILTRDEAPMGTPRDTDRDDTPDHLDVDDDGDGLLTADECATMPCRDTDMDGDDDFVDGDDDGDGIPTARERADGMRFGNDVDTDGMVNWLDTESDGDGAGDREEGLGDVDGDGIPNYLDDSRPNVDGGVPDGGVPDGGARDGGGADDGGAEADAGRRGGGIAGGACGCVAAGSRSTESGAGAAMALLIVALLALRRAARRRASAREVRASRVLAAGLALGASLGASRAEAQVTLDQFRSAELSTDGFAISRPDGLGHLSFGERLTLDYALNPLVYESTLGSADSESLSVVEHQLVGTVGLGLGLFDRLTIYLGLPITLFSDGDAAPGVRGADGTQVGDPYLGARVRLFGEANDVLAMGLQLGVTLPLANWTSSTQRWSGERSAVFVPRLMAEIRAHARFRVNLQIGGRFREESELDTLDVGQELTFGASVTGVLVEDLLDATLELYGATGLTTVGEASQGSGPFGRQSTPVELLLGARVHPVCGLVVGLAGGIGISRGYGAPDFRGVLTVGYAHTHCGPEPVVAPPVEEPVIGDRDGDGLLDDRDECPSEPEDRDGYQDENGCPDPDNDGDGVLDVNDGAPMDPEDPDGWQDEDGVPDPDNDGDLVPDTSDGAPNDPEDRDGFADADGVPDPDNDRDTVPDPVDQCPTAPGRPEDNGCPRTIRVDEETGTIFILQRVEFATNRDVILDRSFPVLEEVRAVIDANPQLARVRIEGHTDSQGRDDRNLDLSRRRARSVMRWLVEHGIAPERLEAWGCGEVHPMETNSTREGRQANRRVEFHIMVPVPAAGARALEGCVEVTD